MHVNITKQKWSSFTVVMFLSEWQVSEDYNETMRLLVVFFDITFGCNTEVSAR
jgi:hypothetical protein